MVTIKHLAAGAALALAAPALAQQPAPAPSVATQVMPGAKVYDTASGEVGLVTAVAGGVATVDTGSNKVGLPLASFAVGANGPIIAMTKAQLDEAARGAAQAAAAATAAALTVGAAVSDPSGAPVGKIEAVDADLVTLATPKAKARLPRTAFTKGPGGLIVSATAADIEAAAKAAPATPGTSN